MMSEWMQEIVEGSKIIIVRDAVPEHMVGVTITLPDGSSYKGAIDTVEQRDLLLELMTIMTGGEEE